MAASVVATRDSVANVSVIMAGATSSLISLMVVPSRRARIRGRKTMVRRMDDFMVVVAVALCDENERLVYELLCFIVC